MESGKGPPAGADAAVRVVVCACTFRRPEGLVALLEGLRQQRFRRIAPPDVLILITDNEGSARAKAICATVAADRGFCVRYLVEERRGISFARNRCLEAVPADADFIAMIDDDERPEPEWLEELLLAQAATAADVVQGRVLPVFAEGTPAWVRDGGYFGYPLPPGPFRREEWADLQEIASAATNNVLVRAAAVAGLGLRFDPRLGLTGGSDALFFRALRAAGHRIVYAERAVVCEDVPLSRASLGYVWRRSYRDGSKRLAAKLWARAPGGARGLRVRGRLALRAMAQAARAGLWLLARGLLGQMNRALLAHGLVKLANACGTLAACAGLNYEHYRHAGDPPREAAAAPR
jgi:succinoglycan biosynthesis protein ExoM